MSADSLLHGDAQKHLSRRCPRMKGLIKRVGPCTLEANPDSFGTLSRSIVAQQISTKAASSISGRIKDLCGRGKLTPAKIAALTDEQLRGWYHAADALAFPSLKEGWGLAVLEAACARLPVIASDLPVFREYLVDGHDALLARAGDSDALAAAMHRMATDGGLRELLRTNAKRLADRFTWDATADAHRELYGRVHTPARRP